MPTGILFGTVFDHENPRFFNFVINLNFEYFINGPTFCVIFENCKLSVQLSNRIRVLLLPGKLKF